MEKATTSGATAKNSDHHWKRPIATIHASHIEQPDQTFVVEFEHAPYRPDGVPVSFPAQTRQVRVLAQTESGAIRIAQYHHFRYGSGFWLVGGVTRRWSLD